MTIKICVVCGAAENPLGRLRFLTRHGIVYCENDDPGGLEPKGTPTASAGLLVVIPCPECRGVSHKPYGKICTGCAGYGSVRIPENNLVVYRPRVETKDVPSVEFDEDGNLIELAQQEQPKDSD